MSSSRNVWEERGIRMIKKKSLSDEGTTTFLEWKGIKKKSKMFLEWKGTTTGPKKYDKWKAQKRKEDKRKLLEGDFSGNSKATPEQIEKRIKREKREKILLAKKHEKRHRGGYHKTKKGIAKKDKG